MADPFLRWAGSKRRLLDRLADYWTGAKARYVEPFAGSACLFFRLEPQSALLGDINKELIDTYRIVRSRPFALHRRLRSWENTSERYYELRAIKPWTLNRTDRAARFIYLNRFCFNGIYRTSRSGQFNVPYGGAKSGAIPTEADLHRASKLLARAELVAGDFARVLDQVRQGDFVYLDPPFSVRARRVFKQYDRSVLGEDDLSRLKEHLSAINEKGATFLLSYADSHEGRTLAKSYASTRVYTRRNIAGFTGHRRKAVELLITNLPSN